MGRTAKIAALMRHNTQEMERVGMSRINAHDPLVEFSGVRESARAVVLDRRP